MKSVRLAESFDKLIEYINMYLADPLVDSQNRQTVVEKFIKYQDGFSFKRNVKYLEEILEKI